jgi:hypothetical protein
MAGSVAQLTHEAPKSQPEIELGCKRRTEDQSFLPFLPLVLQIRNRQIELERVLKRTDIRIRLS